MDDNHHQMVVADFWDYRISWSWPMGPNCWAHRLQLLASRATWLRPRNQSAAYPASHETSSLQKTHLESSKSIKKTDKQTLSKFHYSKILCLPESTCTTHFIQRISHSSPHSHLAAVAAARSCLHNEGMHSWSPAHIEVGNNKRSNSVSTLGAPRWMR